MMVQQYWSSLHQPACLSQITFMNWSQGCNWMWQVGLRISWLIQGLLLCPDLPWSLLENLYHFGCHRKNIYKKDSPEYFFVWGMDKYFPTSFWCLWKPAAITVLIEDALKLFPWGQTNYFYQPPSETTPEWEYPFMVVWSKDPQI